MARTHNILIDSINVLDMCFKADSKLSWYKKILILLELARYIVLNPVRAQMVGNAKQWRWSSYRATAGYDESNACLSSEWVLAGFASTKIIAQKCYRDFIQAGKRQSSPWQQLKNQIYLGDDDFVNEMQCKIDPRQSLQDIPKKQKQAAAKPLAYFAERYKTRNKSMTHAYLSGHYTLAQVGKYFGVSYATVSRAEKKM